MSELNFKKSALFVVTLFLLSGFSNSVFGQQKFEQRGGRFFQNSNNKNLLTASTEITPENRIRFFPTEKNFPNADVFPTAKKQTANTYVYPDKNERFKKYVKRMFGPYALIGDVASAGFAQITDEPEEWENNSKGFGRRLASTVGRSIISQTVTYGLDESFKLDSNYYKSGSKNLKDRFKNALLSTFTARKPDGKRVFGFPRIAGIYTSAVIANQFWYPSRYDYKDGLTSGTYSLGTNLAVNFLREFF